LLPRRRAWRETNAIELVRFGFIHLSDPSSLPPRSNRLSDAPTAREVEQEPGPFFGGVVSPRDLTTVFQPIVSLSGGEVMAYEALVRCAGSALSPVTLFERAAADRSAGRLGRMVREIAVPLCSGMPLFVNLHPAELEEGWLVRPDDPVFSHDHDIYVEITESAPLTHFDLCASVLRDVCGRVGVYLAVDDLGAGYSNLKLIAELQPRVVKLDRNLIQDLDRKPRQQKIVEIVVHLCQDLGAFVIAEGIETRGEWEAVRDAGGQYGQGYLFARPEFPMPAVSWPPPPASEPLPSTKPSRRV
jgi:EAL domain-containing protein (putative c-di-GMP-specific phosphodiesterase class I)